MSSSPEERFFTGADILQQVPVWNPFIIRIQDKQTCCPKLYTALFVGPSHAVKC